MAGYRNTPSGLRDTAGYSILQNQLLHYSLAVTRQTGDVLNISDIGVNL